MILKLCLFLYTREGFFNTIESSIHEARLYRLKASLRSCGKDLHVQFPVTITDPQIVSVGENVSLAAYVHIWGGGGVTIGNRVMIGTHTSITSLTHDYRPMLMFDTLVKKQVVIDDDVWIGSNVVILPNTRIGKGAVVGAGSIVTKDVKSGAIVFGVPAREHGMREGA